MAAVAGATDRHSAGDGPEDETKVEIVDLAHHRLPPLGGQGGQVITTSWAGPAKLKAKPKNTEMNILLVNSNL